MKQGGWYGGFGLRWQSEVALRRFTEMDAAVGPADVIVTLTGRVAERELLRLHPGEKVQRAMDGFRYTAAGEAVLDVYRGVGGDRVLVTPLEDWVGEPPVGFYATMAALLLVLRGAVPLHGSAVEFGGQAVLLCGPGGAGKSTLAAGLIALGGRLISDDLSVLQVEPGTGAFVLYAGRRTMRLFAATAGYLQEAVALAEEPYPADGKMAVAPPQVEVLRGFPLTKVMLLGESADKVGVKQAKDLLAEQMFRPKWMGRFPGQELRLAALALAARQIEMIGFKAGQVSDQESFLKQAKAVAERIL